MTAAGREQQVVAPAQPRSYYGQPILKQPVWTWEIPWYFFVGGIAGASAGLGLAADVRGERHLPAGVTVYLEVQNLTNRANAEEIIYSADFSQRGYLTSLPLLAIAGVRIER